MLSVLLSILKILGIILLSILGLVILLVLLILLVPFRYQVISDNKEKINATIKITYLLHFVSITGRYKDSFNLRMKILGIPFYDKQKKAEKLKKKELKKLNKSIKKKDSDSENCKINNTEESSDESYDNTEITNETENYTTDETSKNSETSVIDSKENNSFDEDDNNDNKEKISFVQKIKNSINKFINKIKSLGNTAKEKFEKIIDSIDYYDKLFSKKGTEYVIDFLKEQTGKVLKHICPRKSNIKVNYSSEDPEKVGKFYSIYGMAMPFLPKHTDINLLYDEDLFEYKVKIKGRIILGYLAIIGIKVMFNKKVKKFFKLLKREEG